jgi:two-component SAPR family response regulator
MTDGLGPIFHKVMIVDDGQIDRFIASRLVLAHKFGEEIQEFESADDALDYLRIHQLDQSAWPDVIFLDIYMPIKSGFGFLEEYDSLNAALKLHCKVYMISSTSAFQDFERLNKEKNVIGFKEKPLTKEFLDNIRANTKVKSEV